MEFNCEVAQRSQGILIKYGGYIVVISVLINLRMQIFLIVQGEF